MNVLEQVNEFLRTEWGLVVGCFSSVCMYVLWTKQKSLGKDNKDN